MNILRSPRLFTATFLLFCAVSGVGCGVSEGPRTLPVTPPMPSGNAPAGNVEIRVARDSGGYAAWDAARSAAWPSEWSVREIEAAVFIQNAPVYFYYDSAALTADAKAVLRQKAQIIRTNPQFTVIVSGHCDERGSEEYNHTLGGRRAKAAMDFLISQGVPARQIESVSFGKNSPQAAGKDESAWSRNRRAEFTIQR